MAEQKYIQAVYEGRASYLNVFEPHAMSEGDPPMYSLCLIIPKSDKETITRLYKAVEAAKEIGKKQLWGGVIPEEIGNPIHDGNVGRPKDPNYKDCVSSSISLRVVTSPSMVCRTPSLVHHRTSSPMTVQRCWRKWAGRSLRWSRSSGRS